MPAINLNYVHSSSIGYGRLGVYLARELERMGVTVYDGMPHDAERENGRTYGQAHVCCWVSVPSHARGWWRSQYPVMFTMWEAMKLPPTFRASLHEFPLVIVPSHQNVELFSEYHDNVQMIPLGVDPDTWQYRLRSEPQAFFNFMVAGSGPRKGNDLVHKAFRKLWGKPGSWPRESPIPKLTIKTPRGEDFYGERIEIVSGRLPAHQEVLLYEQAHCYVQPSRGEGFGLQPLQAMAQGCPTILTAAHGHDSFCHLGYGIGARPEPAAYFIYGDAGDWWEPDFDQLCERMKWVYENWEEAREFARDSAGVIAEEFTWANTAQRFVAAIGPEKLEIPYVESEWFEPEEKRYLVILKQDMHCDIGQQTLQFRRGEEYWELADVKRVMFEAGLLDPRCLEGDDPGLTPEQMEELRKNSAAFSNCQMCGQPLQREMV